MDLLAKIRALGEIHSIDFIGVAGIARYQKEIAEIGGNAASGYPRALSIGIALPNSIVDLLGGEHTYENVLLYNTHAYTVVNDRLNAFSSTLASLLQREGHRALPVPAAERIDGGCLCASVSQKMIARLAGFGWIGKSCLLITPEHGPRVRWTTVLTDAPLEENENFLDVRCGDCDRCVAICPAQAFTGRNYVEGEPREARYDARKCEVYLESQKDEVGRAVCGMCLYVCPYGH
ncbi:4Fe-4S double cluster binding domain-containing protein [Oscillospiraceae bacterium WX1]